MVEFQRNPFDLLQRAWREGGELVEIELLRQPTVLVTGPEANEAFFRAPDDQLCRREAYKLMTPIFGEGVVFDAPGSRLDEQMRLVMRSLRDEPMRRYPSLVVQETERLVSQWGDEGEIELLHFCKELFLYTATRCLMGEDMRAGVDAEFETLYGNLEKAINPIAYFYPHLPIPTFQRRDAARARLVERVTETIERRLRAASPPDDGLQRLIDGRYTDGERMTPHEITGVLIAIIFAGHHTSAGTQTWTLIELLRNPAVMRRLRAETDALWDRGDALDLRALRDHRLGRNVLRETLRLHPPLIFLFRKVLRDWQYKGWVVEAGKMLCASPAVSHRVPETYPDPERFDPERFERGEADNPFAYIAFGGGKHKCTGNAFGLLQIQVVTQTLLRDFDFELVDPPESYVHNYKTATVMPQAPVRVRYRRRAKERARVAVPAALEKQPERRLQLLPDRPVRVRIDRQLCQGHAVCVSEAPGIFELDARGEGEVKNATPGSEAFDRLARAYEHCPNHAILVEQD
ncbi:MAG: cytochrome P450 [Myxococcales bacterium]|nr:cytochrome P450 [Myxococcales bacterium]